LTFHKRKIFIGGKRRLDQKHFETKSPYHLEDMMKILSIFFLSLAIILFSANPGLSEEKNWNDEAEFSFVQTDGNTDVSNIAAKNLLKWKFTEKLSGTWKLGVLYGESDGETNAEKYFTDLRMDYLFTKKFYGALIGGWLKDEFDGIDARYYAGPTLGYKFLIGPKHFLLFEAGVNYVSEAYTDDTLRTYVGNRTFGEYKYQFNDKTRFTQTLEFLYDFDESNNYLATSVTALTTALNSHLSMKASYEVKYDNEPVPETLEKTDTVLSMALLINF